MANEKYTVDFTTGFTCGQCTAWADTPERAETLVQQKLPHAHSIIAALCDSYLVQGTLAPNEWRVTWLGYYGNRSERLVIAGSKLRALHGFRHKYPFARQVNVER